MNDIKIVSKTQEIELNKLHIRYIPVVTPIKLWNYNMSLSTSPHVELLSTIKKHGFDWTVLENTRYWKERSRRHDMGFKSWTTDKIKCHIKRRWDIYKSLKSKGFKQKLSGDKQVLILKKPFWKTRFGLDEKWLDGYEIWDGGGRCMAAYQLGWKTVPALICEDTQPGSKLKGKFEEKLKCVKGMIW